MKTRRIMYDITLMQPGCAILQALGGEPQIASLFDSDTWLLAPTPNLKAYEVTDDQLKQLVARSKKRRK